MKALLRSRLVPLIGGLPSGGFFFGGLSGAIFASVLVLTLALPSLVHAEKSQARALLADLDRGVSKFTLANGLRVVVYRREQAPIFTGQIWVRAGGVDEQIGKTGVAHLLEHMAFKGTETIGTKDYDKEKVLLQRVEELITLVRGGDEKATKEFEQVQSQLRELWVNNEFSRIYQKRGAVGLNAATGNDYTYYMVSLPTSAFELWCWMESERLLNPVFRQFYKELEVVKEERRMRTDDDPGGKVYEALLATAFWSHPNRFPTIGWPSDLQKLRKQDIREYYEKYYRPDNMVLSLVGDLDVEKIRPVIERYFSRFPKAEGAIEEIRTVEPPQLGERSAIVRFDANPMFVLAYHKPVYPNKDDLQFSVVHSLLSEGRSSLFYRELVQRKQLATSLSTGEAPGERYASLFYVWGVPRQGVSNEKLIGEAQGILDRLKTESVDLRDLEAAKKRVKVGLLQTLSSNSGLARMLGRLEVVWGDWEVLFEMYDQLLATTPEDVTRLASTYFNIDQRTVVTLESPKEEDEKSAKNSASTSAEGA